MSLDRIWNQIMTWLVEASNRRWTKGECERLRSAYWKKGNVQAPLGLQQRFGNHVSINTTAMGTYHGRRQRCHCRITNAETNMGGMFHGQKVVSPSTVPNPDEAVHYMRSFYKPTCCQLLIESSYLCMDIIFFSCPITPFLLVILFVEN